MRHRNTDGLSDTAKHIIASCENAYVENGVVYDPCHFWFSQISQGNHWEEQPKDTQQ